MHVHGPTMQSHMQHGLPAMLQQAGQRMNDFNATSSSSS
jgi:hypothetical protein